MDLTGGDQKRDFIYVNDFADALAELITEPKAIIGKIISISYGEGFKIRAVVEYFKQSLRSRSKLNFGAIPYRQGEMMDFQCDVHRIQGLLRGGFGHGFYEALQEHLRNETGEKS